MSEGEPPRPKEDVVFVHGPADGGEGYKVIRKRDDAVEVGEIRAVQEGKPLQGDLVKLTPRKEHDRLFDVEVVVSREELGAKGRAEGAAAKTSGAAAKGSGARAHVGPAQVATDAYRANWDAIFGARGEPKLPN